MKIKFFILASIVMFLSGYPLFSQVEIKGELLNRLAGKKKFDEIIRVVHNYYKEQSSQLKPADSASIKYMNRQIKFWNRWEWFNRARLDDRGNIVNVNQRNWSFYQQQSTNPTLLTPLSSFGFWAPIGPTSFTRIGSGHGGGLGRVNCVAFHPTDPNVFYVGTASGGIWRTAVGGNSWVPLSDHIPSVGVSGIVVSYNNPNTLYVLTGDGDISIFANDIGVWRASVGVLKSTDGGLNWFPTGIFPGTTGDYWGFKLIQDPTNPNILFAATSDGIYKTTDGGAIWTRRQFGKFTDIEFNPGDHNVMYAAEMSQNGAAISNAFYRSTNNGDNWTISGITGIPTNTVRIAIGVSPNQPGYVYLLAGPRTSSGSFAGVYFSLNSGLDFVARANTPNILGGETSGIDDRDQAWFDLAIEINPTNAANVITGGIDVWSSTDGGGSFTNRTSWVQNITPVSKYVHADIHNLTYNPLNNKLYACSDGGISESSDHGVTWTNLWDGLQIMENYHLTGYEGDANKLIGGAQDNGTNYRKNNSNNYYHIEGADGYSAIIDYADTSILYFTANEDMGKSTDGGNSVDNTFLGDYNFDEDNSWPIMAMHTTDHNTIYSGKREGVFKSTNGGNSSWIDKGAGGNIALLTCPSNNSRVYACSGPDVNIKLFAGTQCWRSDLGGDSWVNLNLSPGYPNPSTEPHVTDIAVSPVNSNLVWLTVGGYTSGNKVYYSGNAGDNWTNISGSLPNVATTAIEIDNNSNAYVGTDAGVFYKAWGSGDWVPYYNGLPRAPISDLVINESAGLIRAAVYGRGVFQSTLYSDCIPTLSLAGGITGTKYYEASSTVASTQNIHGASGTEVYYKAGGSITMNPGFEVKEGNFFKALLGPCASGIPSQSALYNKYNVTSPGEILTSELVNLFVVPHTNENRIIITPLNEGEKEISISIIKLAFVQVYFMDETHEILAWLVKQQLTPGEYKLKINDSKLKTGTVELRTHLDEQISIFPIR